MQRKELLNLSMLTAMAIGCGGPRDKAEVTGTVTWQGEPIPHGYITLFLPQQVPAGGGPIQNGKFRFWSKPGSVQVQILADREGKLDPAEKIRLREQYLPPEYNRASTLQTEVQLDRLNTLEYALAPAAKSGP